MIYFKNNIKFVINYNKRIYEIWNIKIMLLYNYSIIIDYCVDNANLISIKLIDVFLFARS